MLNLSTNPLKQRRSSFSVDVHHNSPWAALPADLLHSILMCLCIKEFCAFACVCKSWRLAANSSKRDYLASKSRRPLLAWYDSGSTRISTVSDPPIFIGTKKYKVQSKCCIGLSYGYMIIVNKSGRCPSILDPLFGHSILVPNLPKITPWSSIKKAVLSSPPDLKNCTIFCWHQSSQKKLSSYKINCGGNWREVYWPYGYARDVMVHQQRLFAMTNSEVVVMDLRFSPDRMVGEAKCVALPPPIHDRGMPSWNFLLQQDQVGLMHIAVDEFQALVYRHLSETWEWESWKGVEGRSISRIGSRSPSQSPVPKSTNTKGALFWL